MKDVRKPKRARSWLVVNMLNHTKPGAHSVRKAADKRLARGKVNVAKEGY